jgi:hypothetical protein
MMQIVEQSDEEKMKMYMKCTKKELASMLIECNRILSNIKPQITYQESDLCGHVFIQDMNSTSPQLRCVKCGQLNFPHNNFTYVQCN